MLLLGGFLLAEAQVSFRPGIRAGLSASYFSESEYLNSRWRIPFETRAEPIYDLYAGVYGQLNLGRSYSLQPEITYARQGSLVKFHYFDTQSTAEEKFRVSYLSLSLANKFRFGDFNILFGTTLDFVVQHNFRVKNDVDLGFMLGAGYQLTHNWGIEARARRGIVPVLDADNSKLNTNFYLGLTYTFDILKTNK